MAWNLGQGNECAQHFDRCCHTHTHSHTHICTRTHMHTHTHVHTQMRTHMHTHTRTQTHTHTCTLYMHAHIRTHAHLHTHTRTHARRSPLSHFIVNLPRRRQPYFEGLGGVRTRAELRRTQLRGELVCLRLRRLLQGTAVQVAAPDRRASPRGAAGTRVRTAWIPGTFLPAEPLPAKEAQGDPRKR